MFPNFVRLTIGVALAIAAFLIFLFVVKIVIFAAIVAALVLGGLVVTGAVRRRLGRRGAYPMPIRRW